MFIRNCLTDVKHLTIVHPEDAIQDVLTKMAGQLSLPCTLEDGTFIGLVSKRTIFEALQNQPGTPYESFLKQRVDPCIDRSIRTLHLSDQFEDTIEVIIRHPFVPIVEDGKLVGIVKRGDVNRELAVAFATNVESNRLLLGLAEVEGALQRLFTVTHRLGINVITAVTFDAGDKLNRRMLLKLSKSSNLDDLVEDLERAGFLIIEVTRT